jgi:hypothetical protein
VTTSIWTPTVTVEIDGLEVEQVQSGRVTVSMDDAVKRAYLHFAEEPTWAKGDTLEITAGGGYNHLSRFIGNVVTGEYLNSDGSFQITAYGPLWQLGKYFNPNASGLTLTDLLGGPGTDEAIVTEVLDRMGITNVGTIEGTGIVRGTLNPGAFTWNRGVAALAYLRGLDQGSLGYRLVEEGEDISRRFLSRRPEVSSDKTFTEGVDIFAGARTTKTDLNRYHAWSVSGYDAGEGAGPVTSTFPDPPGTTAVRTFQSNMIERALEADAGTGLSAEAVREYLQDEEDHERVLVRSLATPRDEEVTIGETHLIASLARLGVNENLVVVARTVEFTAQWFTQTFDYEGGT